MQKLLIINNVWSPYVQARYSAIAEFSPFEVTVFFQVKKDPNRKWVQDQGGLYASYYLDDITFSLSKNTALSDSPLQFLKNGRGLSRCSIT